MNVKLGDSLDQGEARFGRDALLLPKARMVSHLSQPDVKSSDFTQPQYGTHPLKICDAVLGSPWFDLDTASCTPVMSAAQDLSVHGLPV